MGWYLLIFAVIVGVALLIKYLEQQRKLKDAASLYEKHATLFTPAERSFLGILQKAVGEHGLIFGKVRVADVLKPKKGLSRSLNQSAFNRISRKHFDFVLCDNKNLSVKCVIELNDKSHQSKKRAQRDAFLQEACNQAGVPMLQIDAKASYQIPELRQLLAPYLPALGTPAPLPTSMETSPQSESKSCPKCGSELVIRTVKKGQHVGKKILACSSFPKCRFYEPYEQIKSSNMQN